MKVFILKSFIIVLFFIIPFYTYSQWNHIYTHDKQIYAIDVVTPDTVYVVGWHTAIRTLDGGGTWNEINYNCEIYVFRDVDFPTSQVGYIISNYILLKTVDFGNNWEQILQDSIAQFIELEFINPDTGWIIGNYSDNSKIILRTYDGGLSWDYYYPNANTLTDIQMINDSIGYITHWDGVLKTINSGDSWTNLDSVPPGFKTCCSFISVDTGFVGSEGLWKTEVGGAEWTFLTQEHAIGFFEKSTLQFINSDTGYYVGYDGVVGAGIICTTENGGINWNKGENNYYDIEMFDSNIGYCIEWTGEIYKTTEGGIIVSTPENRVAEEINIYPVPFKNEIIINILNDIFQPGQPIVFDLYSINGNKVFSRNIKTQTEIIYNLSYLQPGIYIFSIKSENTILKSGKILKTNNK